jgi:hypothetical protein
MEPKGHACDDGGQLFDTVHDVQRHVKTTSASNTGTKGNENRKKWAIASNTIM